MRGRFFGIEPWFNVSPSPGETFLYLRYCKNYNIWQISLEKPVEI